MPLGKCANNHTYNMDKHGKICPICILNEQVSNETKTAPKVPEGKYVCAWLVCVAGINKGRSYVIHSGKNFIGGGDDMDIQILGDNIIELYRHAIIAYDTTQNTATLLPGESRGIVYVNRAAVYDPTEIEDFAVIEVGGSSFAYVPFCSSEFAWSS